MGFRHHLCASPILFKLYSAPKTEHMECTHNYTEYSDSPLQILAQVFLLDDRDPQYSLRYSSYRMDQLRS